MTGFETEAPNQIVISNNGFFISTTSSGSFESFLIISVISGDHGCSAGQVVSAVSFPCRSGRYEMATSIAQ